MFTIYDRELGRIAEATYQMNQDYFFARKWSEDSLRKYQLEQVKKTLLYVKEKSPFYQEHLAGISNTFIDNMTFESFAEIPFTDKATLRGEMLNILSKPVSRCCFFYETTGTTGKATPCPRDYVDTIYNNMAVTSCLTTILKDEPGKEHIVGVCGPTELHSFGDTLGDVCKNMGLAMAKFWAYSPVVGIKKSIQILRDLKITVMMCTPGMILTLAKVARQSGYD